MNNRKRQVLLAAQQLFLEKGFSTTSVQDILDRSGISKGTFYNYFSSKNECLMAILEQAQHIATVKQRDLLIGKNLSDKHVLAEQIAIRLQVNQEQNLIILFEAIFHSKEQEIRDFVEKHYLDELIWLTERLIDVYGKEVSPYAFDCAVILLGMLQHIIHIWSRYSKEKVIPSKPVHFVFRQMDAVVESIMFSKDSLFGEDVFYLVKSNQEKKKISPQALIEQLSDFEQSIEMDSSNGREYIQFLIDELQQENPRRYLIEAISRSFAETFVNTIDGDEAQEITAKLWTYIDTL